MNNRFKLSIITEHNLNMSGSWSIHRFIHRRQRLGFGLERTDTVNQNRGGHVEHRFKIQWIHGRLWLRHLHS